MWVLFLLFSMYQHIFYKLAAKRNNQQGAVIILTCALILVLILILMFSFQVWKVFFNFQDSQSIADAAALRAAEILNENDCIGKVNNMTVMSREMVYDTRASYEATLNPDFFFLEPLGRQLLDQARYGSSVIDLGRKQLILARIDQLERMLKEDDALSARQAEVMDLQVGITPDLKSNAFDDSADEIQEFDLRKRYVDPKTKRFYGNIDAKLPGDDADLIFKLSPLRGIIQGQVQQAGLLSERSFVKIMQLITKGERVKKITCDHMPCAVKIQFSFPAERNPVIGGGKSVMVSTGALTHGGQPVP